MYPDAYYIIWKKSVENVLFLLDNVQRIAIFYLRQYHYCFYQYLTMKLKPA